jgi:hypothetical protein
LAETKKTSSLCLRTAPPRRKKTLLSTFGYFKFETLSTTLRRKYGRSTAEANGHKELFFTSNLVRFDNKNYYFYFYFEKTDLTNYTTATLAL